MAEVEEQTFETFDTFDDAPLDEALESGEVAVDAEEEVITRAAAELPEIKLFGRWSCDDVNVKDMSLSVSNNVHAMMDILMIWKYLHNRITLLSRRSTLDSLPIRPVVMLPSVSARLNAPLWSASPTR